jgi:tetratricopeptide (TPR) repeat protein
MKLVLTISLVCAASLLAQAPEPWRESLAGHQWKQAEGQLLKSLQQRETVPELRALAIVYRATGRLAEAGATLEKAIAIEETAPDVEDLAGVTTALGQLDRAETLLRRALEIREGRGDAIGAIATHQRLSQVYALGKKFDPAEQQANAAIAIRKAQPNSALDLAADLAVLARLQQTESKFPEAAATWEQALSLQEGTYGVDDVRLAPALESIAGLWVRMKQILRADQTLRRVLAIRTFSRGEWNAEAARTMDELGLVLIQEKKFAEAETVFERSLAVWTRLAGPNEPSLAINLDNLAYAKASLQKYAEAEALYTRSLALRDSENTGSLRNLAMMRAAQGNFAEAEPLYRRAVAMLDEPQNRDADPKNQIALLDDYAEVMRQLKKPAEAARLEKRMAAMRAAAPEATAPDATVSAKPAK